MVIHSDRFSTERLHDPVGGILENSARGRFSREVQRQPAVFNLFFLQNVEILAHDHRQELETHAVTEQREMNTTVVGIQHQLIQVLGRVEERGTHEFRTTTGEDDAVNLRKERFQLFLG